MEHEVLMKSIKVFENLGWSVGQEERIDGCPYRFDLVLRQNDKVYGFVEVVERDGLREKAENICKFLNSYIAEYNPLVFIITNGFSFDVYHMGEFYGCLTVPPTPEDVDILFGGDGE